MSAPQEYPYCTTPTIQVDFCTWCNDTWSLNFDSSSNCQAASLFLSQYLSSNDIGLNALVDFVESFVPSEVTDLDVLTWFTCIRHCQSDKAFELLVGVPMEVCGIELCSALEWDGNGDIMGIGMVVVYVMAAILATAYFGLFFYSMICRRSYHQFRDDTKNPEQTFWQILWSGFYTSVREFHNGLTIFTISILCASLVVAIHGTSTYTVRTSSLISTCSTAMYFLILPIRLEVERRRHFAIVSSVVVWALLVAELSVAFKWKLPINSSDNSGKMDMFEELCFNNDAANKVNRILRALVIAGCGSFVFFALPHIIGLFQGKKGKEVSKIGVLTRVPSRLLLCAYCLTIMWSTLILLLHFQSKIARNNSRERAEDEEKWTFGQILALATWAPVIEELIRGWLFKEAETQESRLNHHYTLNKNDEGVALLDSTVVQQTEYHELPRDQGHQA
ncbi:Fc.00g039540.m01.CDS01 [Cosmosporella sp. VM-42]